jgi:hypothetical protein
MPNLNDKKMNAIYAMFKSEPGCRKSTAALSFPLPQYWVSTDRKMESILIPARNWGIDLSQVDYDDYTDWMAPKKKLESFLLGTKYKTIVIDSITSLGDSINRQTVRAKAGESNKQGAEKGLSIGGIAVTDLQDYKAEAAAFNELIDITKTINKDGVNIILIAHVIGERDQSKEGNLNTHFARTIVTGGKTISAKIAAYCTEIYHFNVRSNPVVGQMPDYGMVTVHTGADFARTALPLPGQVFFNDKKLYDTYIKPAMEQLNGK